MANVTLAPVTRPTVAAGLAGLFGLFAGLCAIFAGCVTLIDWYTETAQARWPAVTAIVERAELVASRRTSKDGGGELWRLTTRVRYDVNGEARTATLTSPSEARTAMLTSPSAYSDEEYVRLQAWTVQHPKGSHIDIRYDPSRPNRAVFAAAEPAFVSGGIRDDLILFAIAAIACAVLLPLARFLGARAARAAPVANNPQPGGPLLGSLFAVPGLAMLGSAIYGFIQGAPFTVDNLIGVLIAVMFVLAGIYVGVPPQYRRLRNVLSALVVTCLAMTFDWVAFGPGERHFTGSIGGIGFIPGEMMGRIAFGIVAVVIDICAIAMWVGQCRQMFGPAGSTANQADSTV
jgi:hypothetical protein